MTRSRLLVLLAILCISVSAIFGRGAGAPRITFVHATVIDTTGGPPQKDVSVTISGGRIERVGQSAASADAAEGGRGRVIDARGKFLIPGLWDMHTHVAGINADPKWAKDVLIPLLVANGITGIRDMGGDLEALEGWRHAIESGAIPGPHIVAAGPMLLPAGRAGAPATPVDPAVVRIGSPEEARAAVDSLQKRGADFIKVIQLPRDAYFAMAEEAKKDGISFVGHVPTRVTAVETSNAGQKSIEHIIYS